MEDQLDNNIVEMTGDYGAILWFALSCLALPNPLISLTLHISGDRIEETQNKSPLCTVSSGEKDSYHVCVCMSLCLCHMHSPMYRLKFHFKTESYILL